MKMTIVYVIAVFLVTGCDTVDETLPSQNIEEQSSVLTHSVISKTATSVTFKIVAGKPSSCGDYSRSEVSIVDSVVSVKIFHHYPKGVGCLAVLSSYDAEITIPNLPNRNNYTFKFWVADKSTKDTVVFF